MEYRRGLTRVYLVLWAIWVLVVLVGMPAYIVREAIDCVWILHRKLFWVCFKGGTYGSVYMEILRLWPFVLTALVAVPVVVYGLIYGTVATVRRLVGRTRTSIPLEADSTGNLRRSVRGRVQPLVQWLSLASAILKGLVAVLMLIYAVTAVLTATDWGFLRNEITNYSLLCEHDVEYGICNRVSIPLNPTTFKVMADRQEVVYWTELGPGLIRPERLTKCAVRDRRNWSCRYRDESAEFGFSDGAYWERTLTPGITAGMDKRVVHVGRWRYYSQKCGGYIQALLLCLPLEAVMDALISVLTRFF